MHYQGRGDCATDDRPDRRRRLSADAGDVDYARTAEERSIVVDPVEVAAADTRAAGLDTPGDTIVPADVRAVGEGLRAPAAHLVQAPLLLLSLGTECVHELAVLEVASAGAVVV